jgi:hypothetical protein
LALLALLYFAQARELKRLSEWVARETQRPRIPVPPPTAAVPPAPPAPPAVVGRGPGAPLVAAGVEGVRRVPLPSAAGTTAVVPPPGEATTAPAAQTVVTDPQDGEAPPPAEEQAATPASAPRLIAERVAGQEPGGVHEIGDGLLIGRGKAASLRLNDPLASGRHARIAPAGEQIMLEDLGSTNGTFLNDVQLSAPAPLSDGDRVRFGDSEFSFARGGPAPVAMLPPGPPAAPDAESSAEPASGPVDAVDRPDTDAADETRSAAVPLRATPAAERSLALEEPGGQVEAIATAPASDIPPPPHADSPIVAPAGAPITRRPRGGPAVEAPAPPRRSRRRLRGMGGELDPGTAARRRLAIAGIVVVLALIADGVVVLPGGGGSGAGALPAPARSSITVAVLNATTITGRAGRLAAKLSSDGFVKGVVSDAQAQATATTVGYTAGHKTDAEEVASALHLPPSDVAPVTSANQATATSPGGAVAQVVVAIGANFTQ